MGMEIQHIDNSISIFLENDIIKNSQIDDNAFIAYVALRIVYTCNREKQDYIAYDYIAYMLSKKINNRKLIAIIKKGIDTLTRLSLVTCLNESSTGKELQMDKIIFDSKEKYFTPIYKNEIQSIISSNMSYSIRMLRYFIVTISTLNHSKQKGISTNNYTSVGNQSILYRAEMAKISKNTAITYDNWLENNKLLYIARSDNNVFDRDGKIEKCFCNHYGRYKDKKDIDTALSLTENNWSANRGQKNLRDSHKLSKESKSLIAKMNHIKRGKKYSISEYKKILTYYQNCINNQKYKYYSDKQIANYEQNIKLLQSLIKQEQNIQQENTKSKPCKIDIEAYFKKHIGR